MSTSDPAQRSPDPETADLIERLENWNHGCGKTMIVSKTIDMLRRLSDRAENFRALAAPLQDGVREAVRLLNKIADLVDAEDANDPLDDAIGYANKALAALSHKGTEDDGSGTSDLVERQNIPVTDEMCEAAIKADITDRIQGFTHEKHHVIRDIWKDYSEQKIWEINKDDADAESKFYHQCRVERMRTVLEAACSAVKGERGPAA